MFIDMESTLIKFVVLRFSDKRKSLKTFLKMFIALRDLNALIFSSTLQKRLLLELQWYLQVLMLRFSEVTLRAGQHLNMSGSDHLLFVALVGVVLFLLMYVMHSLYKFLRSKRSSNVRKYRLRNLQGKIWSRRKVFWRQMKISRSAYITLAQQRLVYNRETGDSHTPV